MARLQVLDPEGESAIPRLSSAPRLPKLEGKTVWFLDNQGEHWGKGTPQLNPIFRVWKERLERDFKIDARFACTEQFTSPYRHGKQKFEEVAKTAHAVVNGLACCGSGTSAVIHDAVQYEQRGVPTVTLVTDSVEVHARAATLKTGLPELKVLYVSRQIHMFSARVPFEISRAAAEALYPQVVASLLL